MHADLAGDLQSAPEATPAAQQRALDRWRQEFNHLRPHDALGGKTPAEVFKPTKKRKPVERPFVYAPTMRVVRVHSAGTFTWCGSNYFLGTPLRGLQVGVQAVDLLHVRVWLRDIDLGTLEIAPAVSDAAYEQTERPKKRRTATKDA